MPDSLEKVQMKEILDHIAFGCSHTLCDYLPKEETWPYIIKSEIGTWFARFGKHGAGFSWLVVSAKDHIRNGNIVPEAVKYIILQKPQPIRYPWWGTDETGYRYPDKLIQRDGMRVSWRKFKKLSAPEKKELACHIFESECVLLREFRDIFSCSKISYYHYWLDDIMDRAIRPEFADHNNRLGVVAEELGMDNWGTIIDPKDINGVYDEEGDILMSGLRMYRSGMVYAPHDLHPSSQFNQIVARKAMEWIK